MCYAQIVKAGLSQFRVFQVVKDFRGKSSRKTHHRGHCMPSLRHVFAALHAIIKFYQLDTSIFAFHSALEGQAQWKQHFLKGATVLMVSEAAPMLPCLAHF
jgi:hypothetical protein